MATHTTFRENLLRVIAVIGLIAILLLGAWGIIQLAFRLPTFFSTFGRAKETLSVSVPAQSASDKAMAVSWKHGGKSGEYSYSLSYSCAEGLAFAAPVPAGAYQLVKCDTPFNYTGAPTSTSIIPVLKDAARATTTITVAATRLSDGVVTKKATGMTMVAASTTAPATKPAAAKPATTSAKPASTYVASGRTTNLYGAPDLSVQILTAPAQAQAGMRVSLQFVVTNIGTNLAPAGWTFNAILPYDPIYVYPAGGQQMLYPGDKIVYTLGYDAVPSYGYYGSQAQATIEVDPTNYVAESGEYNNSAVATYQVY